MVIPIILCGGGGTRLWPLSNPECPKPFLSLLENEPTLFQQTLQRAAHFSPPVIICHATHLPLVQKQADETGIAPCAIILEPQSQGTAAAMAVACLSLKSTFDNATLLALPADLVIHNQDAFRAAVELALPYAEKSNHVTFGIKPTRPEPRFGYIETANAIEKDIFQMQRFTEKPSLETATKWMGEQKYFWNSGMFVLSLAKVLFDLHSSQKVLMQACSQALKNSRKTNNIIYLDEEFFRQAPQLSFEKALMEQANQGIMVQGNFDWNDAGTWQSLWELQAKNPDDNVGHGDTQIQNSKGCYVHATTKHISVLGCEDLVIVETADEILVTTKEAADRIGQLTKK